MERNWVKGENKSPRGDESERDSCKKRAETD